MFIAHEDICWKFNLSNVRTTQFGFPETFPTFNIFNIPDHSRQCDWLPTSRLLGLRWWKETLLEEDAEPTTFYLLCCKLSELPSTIPVRCHLSSPLRPSVHASQVFSSMILYPSCRAAVLGRTWSTSQKKLPDIKYERGTTFSPAITFW